MFEITELANKVVLITAVSGGIGLAILRHFSTKGAIIVTSCRRKVDDFWKYGNYPAKHHSFDLTIEENVEALMDSIKLEFGRLDVMVNCVGGNLSVHRIEDYPIEEFDKIISVNLRSAFLLTKHAFRLMKNNESGGNIIHIVSSAAKLVSEGKAPYGIAKAGLAHLIHFAAVEGSIHGIKVNGVSPTYVFTERHKRELKIRAEKTGETMDTIIKQKVASQLIKRPMNPDDLVDVVLLLSTTNSITGQVYNCSMGEILFY
ncbi:MAG: SDR family NAD(P)-dependent oxidoreductase [Promethearchaeota archaeon]